MKIAPLWLLLTLPCLQTAVAGEGKDPGAVAYGPKGLMISDGAGNNTLALNLRFEPRLDIGISGDPDATDADKIDVAAFRIRRALLRAEGRIGKDFVYKFRIDAAKAFSFTDADGVKQTASKPILDDAQVGWNGFKPFQVYVGQWKVPFIAGWITGTDQLAFAEQSTLVDGIKSGDTKIAGFGYSRDIGAAVQGTVAGERFDYAVGVFNGAGANTLPSDLGVLTVARVQATPMGKFAYDELDLERGAPRLGVGLGVGWNHRAVFTDAGDNDGANEDVRVNGDVRFAASGFTAVGEVVYDHAHTANVDDPARRLGAYGMLTYVTPFYVAPAVRVSWVDPSLDAQDDAALTADVALNVLIPDATQKGGTMGHHVRVLADWNATWVGSAKQPLGHLLTVGAAFTF